MNSHPAPFDSSNPLWKILDPPLHKFTTICKRRFWKRTPLIIFCIFSIICLQRSPNWTCSMLVWFLNQERNDKYISYFQSEDLFKNTCLILSNASSRATGPASRFFSYWLFSKHPILMKWPNIIGNQIFVAFGTTKTCFSGAISFPSSHRPCLACNAGYLPFGHCLFALLEL